MENASEKTFKDLQMDERYKRLERTLKMVLLKNADGRNTDERNSCTWPSISSINGDNLDTSCAAMSLQSSRIGSVVVSSSSNLRNMLQNKQSVVARNSICTSSEKQFPLNKNCVNDSAMMPPPRTPVLTFGKSTRSSIDNGRTPLLNVSLNREGNSSNSKCAAITDVNSGSVFKENNEYRSRTTYNKSNGNSQSAAKAQDRIFSRWRVLINDKGQLIIKGTLECGKVARSKPVIRRLTATSVQSIFKHTYHLRGILVDERGELPDYVRGKFYNGFPDDWENVYQVWRNFVGDGSRLSFRWPTPITDSDEDLKSEITELSCYQRFEKRTRSRSPRKRVRSIKSTVTTPCQVHNENHLEKNVCACSRMNNPSVGNSLENSMNLSKSRANDTESVESPAVNATCDKSKSLHDSSIASTDGKQRFVGNSLKDIIQEDKLNIIIDNLTNKNCSIEYIQKIVEMFDCMKYVVSYQSAESDNTEKSDVSKCLKDSSRTPMNNRSAVETSPNISQRSFVKLERCENQQAGASGDKRNVAKKLRNDWYGLEVRRKLSKDDYESSEPENDYYDTRRRTSNVSLYRSHEKIRKSQRFQDYRTLGEARDSVKFAEECAPRDKVHDSSLSEEEFSTNERSVGKELRERKFASPRKNRVAEKDLRRVDPSDSNVSITEDDNEKCQREKFKVQDTRTAQYDSSVSITEDERPDRRIGGKIFETMKYYRETSQHSIDNDSRKTSDFRDDGKKTFQHYPETIPCPVDSNIGRNTSGLRNSRHNSTFVRPDVTDDNHGFPSVPDPTINNRVNNGCTENFVTEKPEDLNRASSDPKLQKKIDSIRTVVEAESDESSKIPISTKTEFEKNPQICELPSAKMKIQKVTKMPVVVSSEIVNINIRGYDQQRNKNENDVNMNNNARSESNESFNEAKNNPISQRSPENFVPERVKSTEKINVKLTKKEANTNVKDQDGKTRRETNSDDVETKDHPKELSIGRFGSEDNPKQLTGWVPAVICDKNDESKCRLSFEGKLLNEAGHVVNRKFTTDFVKRRLSAKMIETIDHVVYRLVGDLNDTKHVVPKDLVKQCRAGCPMKINQFCEKWKLLSSENNVSPTKQRLQNTSIDCLGVPTSSRGRRILPPLNYWTGERVTMKDNKAIYNPGNCEESLIHSTFEKIEVADKRTSPRGHASRGANHETRTKKKKAEKISPNANKSSAKKPPISNGAQKGRSGKRRLARRMQDSSSESEEEEETKSVLRKRKTRTHDLALNTNTTSSRKLRYTNKNTMSFQSPEQSTSSRSFEKPAETEIKSKLRKRQKIDEGETQSVVTGPSTDLKTRGLSNIMCTFYKNVPLRNDDLSEDQLSTI